MKKHAICEKMLFSVRPINLCKKALKREKRERKSKKYLVLPIGKSISCPGLESTLPYGMGRGYLNSAHLIGERPYFLGRNELS
jgi:hypothetical protein